MDDNDDDDAVVVDMGSALTSYDISFSSSHGICSDTTPSIKRTDRVVRLSAASSTYTESSCSTDASGLVTGTPSDDDDDESIVTFLGFCTSSCRTGIPPVASRESKGKEYSLMTDLASESIA